MKQETIKETIEQTEKKKIKEALTRFYGNKTLAAKFLGMHKNTMYKKCSKYGLNELESK